MRGLWAAAFAAAFLFAGFLGVGCAGPDDITQAPKPEAVSFGGKIDPRFVGKWSTADGTSTIEMKKDGSADMVSVIRSPNGKSVEKVSGKWLTNAGDLLFDYSDKSHEMIVVKYAASLSGKTMTLAQAGGRIKTKYKKS